MDCNPRADSHVNMTACRLQLFSWGEGGDGCGSRPGSAPDPVRRSPVPLQWLAWRAAWPDVPVTGRGRRPVTLSACPAGRRKAGQATVPPAGVSSPAAVHRRDVIRPGQRVARAAELAGSLMSPVRTGPVAVSWLRSCLAAAGDLAPAGADAAGSGAGTGDLPSAGRDCACGT